MPSLSDQIELTALAEVPDSHAWPTISDHPYGDDPVPVVDLADTGSTARIGRACEDWGAFLLTGHGVPLDLLARVEAQAASLFALPAERKLRAARGRDGGAGGYGSALISDFFEKRFWSEGFTVVRSPREDANKLWNDGDENCGAEFCDTLEEYSASMKNLSSKLVLRMLLSLGLTDADVDSAGPLNGYDKVAPVLQLNYYPACPEPDRAMGLAEHTDSSLVTILHQSVDVSGLQLLHAGRWVAVPPAPGALVVNVGDLAHILSNGRFRSVRHRAVVDRTRARISVGYFCGPPAQFIIKPIEKLVGLGRAPAYRGVTWPEYLSMKKKLYNETLASIRLEGERKEGEEASVEFILAKINEGRGSEQNEGAFGMEMHKEWKAGKP